jgi:hypothetical protein
MRSYLRQHHLALVALFFAMTGGAFALQGKNSVDSGDIKPANVRKSDLAANSVVGSKVVDDSLGATEIDESSLQLPEVPSSLPPSGPAGGDLSGSYPSPGIASEAVGSAEVAADSLDAGDIAAVAALGGDYIRCADPVPDDGSFSDCATFSVAQYIFTPACQQEGANFTARLRLASTVGVWALDTNAPNGVPGTDLNAGIGVQRTVVLRGPTATEGFDADNYAAIPPTENFPAIAGEVGAGTEINNQDCSFLITATG